MTDDITARSSDYEYIVIGAGPAGLAFASRCYSKNSLVIDLGKSASQRNRLDPTECLIGAGGAGLFSDGKFSFYPAGTAIWKSDKEILRKAYRSLETDLNQYGTIPPFPNISSDTHSLTDKAGWLLKRYPSLYIGLRERMQLIDTLANRAPHILYETEFLQHQETEAGYSVALRDRSTGRLFTLKTRNLVFAGGRFMPLYLRGKKRFGRYEFGFRIAGPTHLFKKEVDLNDPKYIFTRPGVEYRTFCWCERGEVVKTSFKGIESYSGRADGPPTNTSNFGFNIRVKDSSLLSGDDFQKILRTPPYEVCLKNFSFLIEANYPTSATGLITYGLA